MFHVVVVVVGTGTAAVVVLIKPPLFLRDISFVSTSIYLISSIMTRIHTFMEDRKKPSEALHSWLIMLKAWRSMSRYLLPALLEEGLGESDFRVLEVLLHKGPM